MKRLFLVGLAVCGVGLAGLGLLFLIGSAGRAHRLAIAAISLAAGAVCLGFGLRGLRALSRLDPGAVRAEILAEARRRSGSVSESDLAASLGARWGVGRDVLAMLASEDVCRRHVEASGTFYLFPGLQPRLAVRRCEYCSAELPLEGAVATCPKCGGAVKLGVERLTLREDDYRMDG
jgi:hypothetical protein